MIVKVPIELLRNWYERAENIKLLSDSRGYVIEETRYREASKIMQGIAAAISAVEHEQAEPGRAT